LTDKERAGKRQSEDEQYEKLKNEWILKHGNDDGFYLCYSLNVIGNE